MSIYITYLKSWVLLYFIMLVYSLFYYISY